jgi:hypothetical protein
MYLDSCVIHIICYLYEYHPFYKHDRCSSAEFSSHVSHPCFICFATICLLALLTDVSGGRIRMTRIRLIVGLKTPHHTYLTITKTRKWRPRPGLGCNATDDEKSRSVICHSFQVNNNCIKVIQMRHCTYLYTVSELHKQLILCYLSVLFMSVGIHLGDDLNELKQVRSKLLLLIRALSQSIIKM